MPISRPAKPKEQHNDPEACDFLTHLKQSKYPSSPKLDGLYRENCPISRQYIVSIQTSPICSTDLSSLMLVERKDNAPLHLQFYKDFQEEFEKLRPPNRLTRRGADPAGLVPSDFPQNTSDSCPTHGRQSPSQSFPSIAPPTAPLPSPNAIHSDNFANRQSPSAPFNDFMECSDRPASATSSPSNPHHKIIPVKDMIFRLIKDLYKHTDAVQSVAERLDDPSESHMGLQESSGSGAIWHQAVNDVQKLLKAYCAKTYKIPPDSRSAVQNFLLSTLKYKTSPPSISATLASSMPPTLGPVYVDASAKGLGFVFNGQWQA
ncbi:hypothetical protein NP233_g11710 [Leucocoprinus birnbaumii]|uniref:Uncharacterized protein n=1 Tax=Leucocoprinus birnbaumii TaxID=56174 RepID=A0AAD5YNP9_9AGAR|nr:hypothetical protein NP233_g11710 [Leucocoprinus birnbaumii]